MVDDARSTLPADPAGRRGTHGWCHQTLVLVHNQAANVRHSVRGHARLWLELERPDPDELLARIKADGSRRRDAAHLSGCCAGRGKDVLHAAGGPSSQGARTDVVIGFVKRMVANILAEADRRPAGHPATRGAVQRCDYARDGHRTRSSAHPRVPWSTSSRIPMCRARGMKSATKTCRTCVTPELQYFPPVNISYREPQRHRTTVPGSACTRPCRTG